MACKPGQDGFAIAQETQLEKAGMAEKALDSCDKRPEREAVARESSGGSGLSSVIVR